ncbi:MAG: anthranilate synthase component I [Desulfobacteraceae bacterium 4572_35.2]|nr:MAG: anthranilate synthase component I [Desulfobacteraceae bacterium 4572_35.2]
MQIYPSYPEFESLTQSGNLIPIYTEILADMETPVSAFKKIDNGKLSFLLESVEGGEKWARYSFLGSGDGTVFRTQSDQYEVLSGGCVIDSGVSKDPLNVLKTIMAKYRPVELPDLPRFNGGAVGYLGYDMVRYVETLPDRNQATIGTYDSCFLFTDTILIFDNCLQKIKVVCNVFVDDSTDIEQVYNDGICKIQVLIDQLRTPLPHPSKNSFVSEPSVLTPNFTPQDFKKAVERCKEYVRSGDVIQAVLSQRFSGPLRADPFDIYRSLRTINPSPYMFFLRFGATLVVGASPEVLVRKEDSVVEVRPIAGTRPRGVDAVDDQRFEQELLTDPKELAEHVMLVDLGRNDLGRICKTGSIEVSEFKMIERYSHVMHIVSNVRGCLADGCDAFDTFKATFPAGTLTGAPKIRAMQIIDELEPERREIYGGAVGYFSYSGNMDLAIAIRTLVVHDGKIHLQAGAGIVADSDPQAEYDETINKARGVMKAIEMAEGGLD